MKHTVTGRRSTTATVLLTALGLALSAPAVAKQDDQPEPRGLAKGHAAEEHAPSGAAPAAAPQRKGHERRRPEERRGRGKRSDGSVGSGSGHSGSKRSGPERSAPKRSAPVYRPTSGPKVATRTLNSDCVAHKDPRDPGSCQEKGRGNSGDIDPYRGPDAEGNTPARGNDCDEGGGNNRGSYPRKTNPNQPGDSDVDGDRGKGNNRCGQGETTSTKEEGGETPVGEAAIAAVIAETAQNAPRLASAKVLAQRQGVKQARQGVQEERKADPGSLQVLAASATALPHTGLGLLGLLLAGLAFAGGGVAIRRIAAR